MMGIGITSSQAVRIMKENGWQWSDKHLAKMLFGGCVNGTKIDIFKSSTTMNYYNEAQIRSLKPPKPKLTVPKILSRLGISKKMYYDLKKHDPNKLGEMLKGAGVE